MKEIVNKIVRRNETKVLSIQNKLSAISKEQILRLSAVVFFSLITALAIQTSSPFKDEILTGEAIVILAVLFGYLSNKQTVKK